MFRQLIIITLFVVIFVSLNDAAPALYKVREENPLNSDAIIKGQVKEGSYMDNIRKLCKYTEGKIRTSEEIQACKLYNSIANTGFGIDVDRFILP